MLLHSCRALTMPHRRPVADEDEIIVLAAPDPQGADDAIRISERELVCCQVSVGQAASCALGLQGARRCGQHGWHWSARWEACGCTTPAFSAHTQQLKLSVLCRAG